MNKPSNGSDGLPTHFAPGERAGADKLAGQVQRATKNPVIDALLRTVSGLVAILNSDRQIVGTNDALLSSLGFEDARDLFGKRPGEALDCVHAEEEEGGCGTSRYCSSCGAAVAIVATLGHARTEERRCVATVKRLGGTRDICLLVRSAPFFFDEERFVLLFLQDITAQERWAALERAFFHDVNNLVTGVAGMAQLLPYEDAEGKTDLSNRMRVAAQRLAQEVSLHKTLSLEEVGTYQLSRHPVDLAEVAREADNFFDNHPATEKRTLTMDVPSDTITVSTDRTLLLRVLTNMLLNAFEATDPGGEVRLEASATEASITFQVWNAGVIPPETALRIFQRFHTTKLGMGRGVGTHAMKVVGEDLLGGAVTFTTSEEEGTAFRFTLPRTLGT